MRIALITSSYPDGTSGSEAAGSFVEDFAQELSTSADVTVLAASREDSVHTSRRLEIRRFAVPRLPLSLLRPFNPLDWPAIIKSLTAGRGALQAAIRERRPDHILALWALPSGWWAKSAGVPYSTWVLGSDIWSLGRVPIVRNVLRNTLVNAEYRFADGLGLCADVEQLCDRPCSFLPSARKLPARPPAVSASELPYKLAFLGRWHPNKGADLLMQALQLLDDVDWEKIEEVRFFGGGPLEGQIQASAEALSAAGRPVTVGGYLDKSEAADLIAWGDYLLLPSRIESIPVIFSDAMQVGTPLVATPVGDLPRLFERYGAGVLATDATPAAFAEAIREALAHDVAHFDARLQSAGQEFDLTTIVAQFLNGIGAA